MASLGPQVWNPQVILVFFLLLLALWAGCWLWEALATDFLWLCWVAVMKNHFNPRLKTLLLLWNSLSILLWLDSRWEAGCDWSGERSIPAPPTIRRERGRDDQRLGAGTSQWEARLTQPANQGGGSVRWGVSGVSRKEEESKSILFSYKVKNNNF